MLGVWGCAGCLHLGLLPLSQIPFQAAVLLHVVALSLVRTILRSEVYPLSKGEGREKRRVSKAGEKRKEESQQAACF